MKIKSLGSCAAGLMVMLAVACATKPPVRTGAAQTAALEQPVSAEQVKAEFLHAWNGYKQYAWGHDELKPLSKSYRDIYGHSLLITPVDALDTMIIMGLDREAAEAKELIFSQLAFDQDLTVEHFEISMRLLGGLLAAYELDGDPRLLKLAQDLADRMLPVWDSPTGLPYRYINLKTGRPSGPISTSAWTTGYLLEYGTLSRLTGNPVYYQKAKRAAQVMFRHRSRTGLYGGFIDVRTGVWILPDSSVLQSDALYEYLLKGSILFDDPDLKAMWRASYPAIDRYLKDESTGELWYGHSLTWTGTRTLPVFGALDCYFAAMLALNGNLDLAARLQDSAFAMWNLHGIEPESYDYRNRRILVASFQLRPEIIESAYYLHHYTGDEKYRRMGNVFFNSIVKWCRTDAGYASLADVRTKEQMDSQPSWFFSETLKYAYLLAAPPSTFDFDKVVFTTEAHPLARKHPINK